VAEINWTLLFIVSAIFFPVAVWGVYKVATAEGRTKPLKKTVNVNDDVLAETLGNAVLNLYEKFEDLSDDLRRTRKTVEYLHGTFKDYVLPTLRDLKRGAAKLGKTKKSV